MSLHVDRYKYAGTGTCGVPLLLIHGWGMHGGMWGGVSGMLAQHFNVYTVDLPGHGYSKISKNPFGPDKLMTASTFDMRFDKFAANGSGFLLDSIVDELSMQFSEPLNVCGWSLGGQVALRWALRQPQQVERLVMVSSTPCFVRLEDWKHALSVEILREFADNLRHHYALTLRRFLALQVRGSYQEREWLTVLREGLFSRGEPDLAWLESGLEILQGCDLRSVLPDLKQAMLVLAGERDMLIPQQAAQYLASNVPNGRLAMIKGAAHAPFLSHPDEFLRHLVSFLNEKI
jgi:pimeloyl-[acyl-carrier protein] methyl ester esterase